MTDFKQFHSPTGIDIVSFQSRKKEDQLCFLGSQVATLLGHKNITQAIKDAVLIEGEDYVSISKSQAPAFFDELSKQTLPGQKGTKQSLVPSSTSRITIIYESGFWKLAIASRLPAGEQLRHWLATEVLPSLRKTGAYKMPIGKEKILRDIPRLTEPREQKYENRRVASVKYFGVNGNNRDVKAIVEHNQDVFRAVTGHTPSQLKTKLISTGAKVKSMSGREILRKSAPAEAATCAALDTWVADGYTIEELTDAGFHKTLVPVFSGMLKIGMITA